MMNFITALAVFLITSFYSLSYNDINGTAVSMSSYTGKRVLIVNIATGGPNANQISALQQLHQQFGDSLVIIAVPSNQFNNEPHTNAEIKSICQNLYNVTFQLVEKSAVSGSQASPLYNWLTHASLNGAQDLEVAGDFTKFLIDRNGELVGIYSSNVFPTSTKMINAINQN